METSKYEEALSELEKIVREMENGSISIDSLSAKLKRAKQLIAVCRKRLTDVEQTIKSMDSNE